MFPLFRNLCCTDSKKILRRPVKTAVDKAKLCLTIKKATPLIAVADVLSSTLTPCFSPLRPIWAKQNILNILSGGGPLKKTDKLAWSGKKTQFHSSKFFIHWQIYFTYSRW